MADEMRNGEKVGADGWTTTERRDLTLSCPELEGSSREDVLTLAARYGKSMPELRALIAGKPSQGAINEAAQHDAAADAALRRRYRRSYEQMPKR
jgi:hypothetical protein